MPDNDTTNIDLLKIREIFQNGINNDATSKSQINTEDDDFDENDDPSNDESFPGFSQEERKILINKIMEKKRRDRLNQLQQQQQQQQHKQKTSNDSFNHTDLISVSTIAGEENDHDTEVNDSYQADSSAWEGSAADSPTNNNNNNYYHDDNGHSTSSTLNNANNNKIEGNSKVTSSKRNVVITPTSSQTSNQHNFSNRNSYPNNNNTSASSKSIDFSRSANSISFNNNNNNQSSRSFQSNAAVLTEMMKECTFTPRIKILPQHYGSANKTVENAPFYDRVSKWQRDKDNEVNKKKKESEKSNLSGCTFQPRINRNSERAVEEIRKNMLRQSALLSSSSGDGSDKMNFESVMAAANCYDRLYKSNEMSLEQRAKFIEDELKRERQEEELQCTFQPHLITDQSKFTEIVPRYIQPQYLTHHGRTDFNTQAQQAMQKEFTFTPKVKALSPKMVSAQKYLNSNVIDRLTQPMSIEMITRPRSASFTGGGGGRGRSRSGSNIDDTNDDDYSRLMQRSMSVSSGVGDNNSRSVSRGRERGRRNVFATPINNRHMENNNNNNSSAIDGSRSSALNSSRSKDNVRMLNFNQRLLGNNHSSNSNTASSKSNQSHWSIQSQSNEQPQQQSNDSRVRSRSVDAAAVTANRQKQLEVFLSRLEQSDLRRTRHIEELKRSTTPTFQPEIDAHSKRIFQERYGNKNCTSNNNNNNGSADHRKSIEDRMERYLLRRQDNQTRNAVLAISHDKNYTYKPEINQKTSNALKGRSVYELSFGDLIKKESNQRMLKLRLEQEKLAQLTFHPELNEKTKLSKTPSVLRLNEDPSFHLSWQKSRLQNKMNTREMELMKRDAQEAEECTFAPATIDCPEYIRRIAQSMTVIKQAKLQSEKAMTGGGRRNRSSTGGIDTIKPDWK